MTILCIHFNWANFWAFITAMATVSIAVIAWNELSKNRKIKSAEFINEFTATFFSPKTSELLMLFEFGLIEFISKNTGENKLKNLPEYFSYFKVRMEGYKRRGDIPGYLLDYTDIYAAYEIEDLLLGHFEDMGLFIDNKVMTKNFIFDVFGFYIVKTGQNKQIQNYICRMRREYNDDSIFKRFEELIKNAPNNEGFTGFKES